MWKKNVIEKSWDEKNICWWLDALALLANDLQNVKLKTKEQKAQIRVLFDAFNIWRICILRNVNVYLMRFITKFLIHFYGREV